MFSPQYLKRLERHKRVLAAAALAGRLVAYLIVLLVLVALADLGWWLLTGHLASTVVELVGLALLLLTGFLMGEMFRSRPDKR